MKINIRRTTCALILVSSISLVAIKAGESEISASKGVFDNDLSVYATTISIDEEENIDDFNNDDYSKETEEISVVSNEEYDNLIVPGVRVNTDGVNIRSEANTDCDILSVANEDDVFKMITKYNDEWYQIKYNDEIAYINSEYVEETNTIDSDIIDVRYMNDNGSFYDLDGNYMNDLEMYECVEVYGEKDDKYLVSINGNIGYVSKELTSDLTDKCAVIDISSQTLTLYDSNEKVLTTPVVTGKDSTPSDIGLFDIDEKVRNTHLTDYSTYDVPVDFWMPYNGGEGIHDTYWRDFYGGEIYHENGSHGCINTPYNAVSKVYDTLEKGSHVLVKN